MSLLIVKSYEFYLFYQTKPNKLQIRTTKNQRKPKQIRTIMRF